MTGFLVLFVAFKSMQKWQGNVMFKIDDFLFTAGCKYGSILELKLCIRLVNMDLV